MNPFLRRLPLAAAGTLLGGAAIAIAAGIGPVAAADPSTSPTTTVSSPAPVVVPSPAASARAGRTQAGANLPVRPRARALLRATVEADFTVVDRQGGVHQIRYAHGQISAVDASSITLSLRSGDSVTFAVSDKTKVREQGKQETVGDLSVGEQVMVFALKNGSGYEARLIRCVRPAATAGTASPSAFDAGASLQGDLLDALSG